MGKTPSCLQVVRAARSLEEKLYTRRGSRNRRWKAAVPEGVCVTSEEGRGSDWGPERLSWRGWWLREAGQVGARERASQTTAIFMNKGICPKGGGMLKCGSLRGSRVCGWGRGLCPVVWVPAPHSQQGASGKYSSLASDPRGFRSRAKELVTCLVTWASCTPPTPTPAAKPQYSHQQNGLSNLPHFKGTRDNTHIAADSRPVT